MSDEAVRPTVMVDLVFPIDGHRLRRDSAPALMAALRQALPWLEQEPLVGVHPLKLMQGTEDEVPLSHRTRLLIRLPRQRVGAASALAGRCLRLGEHAITLGQPHLRELLPHRTLYAQAVAAEGEDEMTFMKAMGQALDDLQVRGQIVCGKRQCRHWPQGALTTFSLMLHGLSQPDSLRVQERGLGRHRLLGCGIFVPHKSAAAVGDP
jgi:CRISPR-associated protein Cas6